jgi:fluoroacetyl-CoA thioesterase
MPERLEVGRTHEVRRLVTSELTADATGNPGVHVFSTPNLVLLIEVVCYECVLPCLTEGQGTVGTRIDTRHLAPTPVGMTVTARAELTEIDGRRLVFAVEARDEVEPIASGTHERFIVNSVPRFVERAMAKLGDAHRKGAKDAKT